MGPPPQEKQSVFGRRKDRHEIKHRDLSKYEVGAETDPTLLAQAWMKVAEAYKREFAPDRDFPTVLHEICEDQYSLLDRSKTIVMKKPDAPEEPDNPDSLEDFAGAIRLVLGRGSSLTGLSPIEAWDILIPPSDWEIYLMEESLKADEIGELGRLAFAEDSSTSQNQEIARALLEESFSVAQDEGIKRIFAIMPHSIELMFKNGGHEPTHIPKAELRETAKVSMLKRNYPGYWDNPNPRRQPKLCYWDVPRATAA